MRPAVDAASGMPLVIVAWAVMLRPRKKMLSLFEGLEVLMTVVVSPLLTNGVEFARSSLA